METNTNETTSIKSVNGLYEETLKKSWKMDGAMGAIAFAVLEMFRLGGMEEEAILSLHKNMELYFMNPSNEECNAICKMVEARLKADRRQDSGLWYQ